MFDAIDLAIRIGSGVNNAAVVHHQGLYLQLLRLENGSRLAVRRNAIDPGRRAGRSVQIAGLVGGDRPDVSGWSSSDGLERGSKLQTTRASDGYALSSAFNQVIEPGLFPSPCPLAGGRK